MLYRAPNDGMKQIDPLVAAYLARGGAVVRVSEGTRTYSEREMWQARHGNAPRAIDATEQRIIAGTDYMGRSVITNGLGELIAVE